MQTKDPHRYDDMLDMPHPVSSARPHMSMLDRAAQFSPFAALTGYHEVIDETGRFTEGYEAPDELRQTQLNEMLCLLRENLHMQPQVQLTYFLPDEAKSGGRWITVTGQVAAVDPERQLLTLTDDTAIPFERLLEIRAPLFT